MTRRSRLHRRLLAGAALALALAGPARAQMPVIDNAAIGLWHPTAAELQSPPEVGPR